MAFLTRFNKCLVSGALLLSAWANAGVVSVSNYPLALLSNAVTKGGGEPAKVLLSPGDVGHHGSLSPNGVKLVSDSQFVVWFGSELEQNLVNTLKDAPNAISLYRMHAFNRLPLRNIDGSVKSDTLDPHIWLDPENAKAIVRALAVVHGYADPAHKDLYNKNAKEFEQRMDEAVSKLAKRQTKPYWAYHDAYQYLEKSVHISFSGALTPDHHLSPKASQIKLLADKRPAPHMCLVSQGKVSEGIQNKLGNVSVVVKQEDMSDGDDFVTVWQTLVDEIYHCVDQ